MSNLGYWLLLTTVKVTLVELPSRTPLGRPEGKTRLERLLLFDLHGAAGRPKETPAPAKSQSLDSKSHTVRTANLHVARMPRWQPDRKGRYRSGPRRAKEEEIDINVGFPRLNQNFA